MNFYDYFMVLCKEKNVKPSTVCKAIGLSANAPSNWKVRGNTPRYDVVSAISDYFGVDTGFFELLTESENELRYYYRDYIERQKMNTLKKTATNSDGLDEQLLNLLRQVPADKVQRVKDFVSGLIET